MNGEREGEWEEKRRGREGRKVSKEWISKRKIKRKKEGQDKRSGQYKERRVLVDIERKLKQT